MLRPELPLAIVNARSGGGRAGRTAGQVRAVIERSLGPIDLQITEGSGHAIEIARHAVAGGRNLVIAVGGDGTMHEVANGVLDGGGGAAVGYVGQGTGGDFRRTLGIEHRLDAYVSAMASGRTRRVDAGRLRYQAPDGATRTRWFVNILSAGMGGLVDTYVSETGPLLRLLGGKAAYFWASVRALARCPRTRLRCRVTLGGDRHERRLDSLMIAVCNGRYFGGGMHVAPMAKVDDGRFEVISLDAPTKLAFAMSSQRIYAGRHLSAPGAVHFGCDRLAIDVDRDAGDGPARAGGRSLGDGFVLDVDGEALGGLPLEVELVPQALTLRA